MGDRYIKFFGGAWRADPGLRLCSAAARGVWIDCISIMIEAEPHGYLIVNGRSCDANSVASLTNTPIKTVRKALEELKTHDVCSVDENGTIYSRRMIKDKQKQAQASAYGKGGGNPKLLGKDNAPLNPPDKAELKAGDKARDKLARASINHQPSEEDSHPPLESQTPAREVAAAFIAKHAECWPGHGEFRALRRWPEQLLPDAQAWLDRGLSAARISAILGAAMGRWRRDGEPPASLKPFVRELEDAAASAAGRAANGRGRLSEFEDEQMAFFGAFVKTDGRLWRGFGPQPASVAAAQATWDALAAKRDGKPAPKPNGANGHAADPPAAEPADHLADHLKFEEPAP